MKTKYSPQRGAWLPVLASLLLAPACDSFLSPSEDGRIEIIFLEDVYLQTRATSSGLPDTNRFTLKVTAQGGSSLYDGPYGAAPQSILAAAGQYTVSVTSGDFNVPAFSAPQYGDSQQVTVRSGEVSRVELVCRQLNAGVRLKIAPAFLSVYPNASLHLKADSGRLLYSYSEKRFAYFPPGKVSLVMSDGGTDKTLLSRDLAARDMLTLDLGVASPAPSGTDGQGGIIIQVDTTLNYRSESYTIGGGSDKGSAPEQAMGVSDARTHPGAEAVWVCGYIVGGDLSSTKASFQGPFSSRTNLVIAGKSGTTDRSVCMSVQLQKGALRDALNLVDHPENLGREVLLKGDVVEAYYGLPGLQNLTEFAWKD